MCDISRLRVKMHTHLPPTVKPNCFISTSSTQYPPKKLFLDRKNIGGKFAPFAPPPKVTPRLPVIYKHV